jgi:hypothetical protein
MREFKFFVFCVLFLMLFLVLGLLLSEAQAQLSLFGYPMAPFIPGSGFPYYQSPFGGLYAPFGNLFSGLYSQASIFSPALMQMPQLIATTSFSGVNLGWFTHDGSEETPLAQKIVNSFPAIPIPGCKIIDGDTCMQLYQPLDPIIFLPYGFPFPAPTLPI